MYKISKVKTRKALKLYEMKALRLNDNQDAEREGFEPCLQLC